MSNQANQPRVRTFGLVRAEIILWLALAGPGLIGSPAQTSAPPAAAASTNSTGPRLRLASSEYDFGEVTAGFIVRHEYSFTNIGTEDLEITSVQPQCGCTTTGNWTRFTKPGESGVIPIQLNSANFDAPVTKFITITSNDKSNASVALKLKGKVWKPLLVIPPIAAFNVLPNDPFGSVSVRITNRSDQPLILSTPESSNNVFVAILQTNFPGKEFLVTISNTTLLRPRARASGEIVFKTSWTNPPLVTIPVTLNMGPSISLSPDRIGLEQLPIPTNYVARFGIFNNTTNPLVVSDPRVSDTNLTVEIQESQPGKYFIGSIRFPAGFAFKPGKPGLFTARTSDPDVPLIKLPIIPIIKGPSLAAIRAAARTNNAQNSPSTARPRPAPASPPPSPH